MSLEEGSLAMAQKPILIIQAGCYRDTLPALQEAFGGYDRMILAAAQIPYEQAQVVRVFEDEPLPDPDTVCGAIVSGSSAMVTDGLDWIETSAAWLNKAIGQGLPTLGICFGHQLVAHALGGKVGDLPQGPEFGTIKLAFDGAWDKDPLFGGLPPVVSTEAIHFQTILEAPTGMTVMARSELEPRHAVRFTESSWGVQFHPEFNRQITRTIVESKAERYPDMEATLARGKESLATRSVLARFRDLAQGKREAT
jgi:GMP synthase (glutamine-hydrolysing)